MKIFKYCLLFFTLFTSCQKEEDESVAELPSKYGSGMYILTEQGVSFYNYLATDSLRVVSENIFQDVNNRNILYPKSLNLSGWKAYIVGDQLYIANIETFGNEGIVGGFSNPVSCKALDDKRLYVVDKGSACVKVVDLSTLEISGHIETGDTTMPTYIVGSWYRAFVMNGGGNEFTSRDSSIIAIDYFTKYDRIVVNSFSGQLDVGYNPSSAVFGDHVLWVLCKGVYDSANPTANTESSIYQIWPFDDLTTSFNKTLSGIYNANNIKINKLKNRLFFTAEDGVYISDLGINPTVHIQNINASCLTINTEQVNDSTWIEYLYTNDANQSGKVLKYEAWSGVFIESIDVPGHVIDVAFY